MWKTSNTFALEMSLDRKVAPPTQDLVRPTLPEFTTETLDNGLKVNVLHFPHYDFLKIDVAFQVGRPEEPQRLVAYMAPRLMRDGIPGMDSAAIAEHFDYFGSTMSVWSWLDASGFALNGLSKHAADTIPVFADVLLRPTFPQKDLDVLIETHIQALQVELEKPETISYRELTERLFGAQHPLGYNSTEADYRALRTDALAAFQREHLDLSDAYFFISGNITPDVMAVLNQCFGQFPLKKKKRVPRSIPEPAPNWPKNKNKLVKIVQPGSLQSAVKMGRLLFNRLHPDFYDIQILNTILGGYFGSRLMSNIREEKGYTYNIYSGIDTYYDHGYLYIATEVNGDKADATRRAIKAEMKKLREQLIDEEELHMVRNYMLGALLNGMDGPLNMAALMRSMVFERNGSDGLQRQLAALHSITPERIQALSQQYLDMDDFLTVVVRG